MYPAPSEQQRTFWEQVEQLRFRRVALLERAVEKGSCAAAPNLASYYLSKVKGLTDQERSLKANHYFTLEEELRPGVF